MLYSTVPIELVMLRDTVGDFINVRARHPFATRYERWAVTEQLVHIFEVKTFRLWLEAPEEYSVEEVAYHEDKIEFLINVSVNSD